MKSILNKIYNDFFMKNRYQEYEELLKEFLNNGYEFIMIKDYNKLKDKNNKHIILRHDIDTDVKIARMQFEIEKKLGIKSTFYFRLSTLDKDLINDICKYGSEVGYHYEELATYCKKHKIKDKNIALENLTIIEEEFAHNFSNIEQEYNIKIDTIASHGDFVNRKIGLKNDTLINSKLKKKLNIKLEAYEDALNKNIDYRDADCSYPKYWQKENPLKIINKNYHNILLLIHTRWWDSAIIERSKEYFKRVIEGIKYL